MVRPVGSRRLHVAILHGDTAGEAEELRQIIAKRFQ
jgi:hypothetical protein